ncbi:MAG: hypothetical protein VW907_04265 [Opitutae bacterium]
MTISKEQVFQRAVEMSNKKPRVEVSREVLGHIDPAKKVRVYRNLHKGCLSVQQGGLVKCHADNVVLRDFKTIVNKAGQERVRRERAKNVHAFIEGFVIDAKESWKGMFDFGWGKCYYNPYETDHWTDSETGEFIDCGEYADVAPDGVLVFNYLYRNVVGT